MVVLYLVVLLNSLSSFTRFSFCLLGRVLGVFYSDNHVICNRNSFISSFSNCMPSPPLPFSSFIEIPTQCCFTEAQANVIAYFLNLGVRHAVFKSQVGCRVFVDAFFSSWRSSLYIQFSERFGVWFGFVFITNSLLKFIKFFSCIH